MNDPKKIIEELIIILLGIRLNLFESNDIVAYADKIICETENPDYLFIDLSLSSKDKTKLTDHLQAFIDANKNDTDQYKMLSTIRILKEENILNLRGVMMLMYKLNEKFNLQAFEENEIYRLDGQYHLVSDNYVKQTIEEVDTEISNFLNNYQKESEILNILSY
ncbi:MAG: hypothetical protein N4A72_19025 [Bacteroidales bacterium]|jgi:hypothetical protein|nr:hypothetical protein [Bacteroidales bacterium]